VLIDIDATDSYDDLLALDQFNVKRAVKASVLRGLPCRTPDTADEQQQRQCHICLQAWLPQPVAVGDAAAAAAAAGSAVIKTGAGQQLSGHCCSCRCALQEQQQQQQWLVPQLSGLLHGQPQQQQHHLQLVCWEGPSGPQGVIVPAPAPARLLQGGSSTQEGGGGSPLSTPAGSSSSSSGSSSSGSSSSGSSSSGSSSSGSSSSARDGVSASAGVGSVHLSVPRVGGVMRVGQRQVGSSRVNAAGNGSPGVQPAAAAAGHSSLIHPTPGISSSGGEQCCERCCGRVAAAGSSGRAAAGAAGVGRDQGSSAVVQIQQLPCSHE